MDDQELEKLLNQLQNEIKSTQAVDEKGKELLRALDKDIQVLLQSADRVSAPVHPTIIENMNETIDHFEATHLNLTMLVSRLLDILSNTGI